jgi:hypothetical protein
LWFDNVPVTILSNVYDFESQQERLRMRLGKRNTNAKKAQVASGDLQKKQMSDCGVGLSTGSREKVPQKL